MPESASSQPTRAREQAYLTMITEKTIVTCAMVDGLGAADANSGRVLGRIGRMYRQLIATDREVGAFFGNPDAKIKPGIDQYDTLIGARLARLIRYGVET